MPDDLTRFREMMGRGDGPHLREAIFGEKTITFTFPPGCDVPSAAEFVMHSLRLARFITAPDTQADLSRIIALQQSESPRSTPEETAAFIFGMMAKAAMGEEGR